jgi:hypothetical protein
MLLNGNVTMALSESFCSAVSPHTRLLIPLNNLDCLYVPMSMAPLLLASPAQSFLVLGATGPMTIFFCLKISTSPARPLYIVLVMVQLSLITVYIFIAKKMCFNNSLHSNASVTLLRLHSSDLWASYHVIHIGIVHFRCNSVLSSQCYCFKFIFFSFIYLQFHKIQRGIASDTEQVKLHI